MYTDFSWECLRRNPKYIREWFQFKDIAQGDNTDKIGTHSKWGLMKYVNPANDCPEDVFWSESFSSKSISVKIHCKGIISAQKIIDGQRSFNVKYFHGKDDLVCLKLYNEIGYLQIFMDSYDFFNIRTDNYMYISWSQRSTLCLIAFLDGQLLSSQPDEKQLELLRLYDLYHKGHTHREIANFLFGEVVTNSEWESDSWLRARVRYKLKKAGELINNGFIRHL